MSYIGNEPIVSATRTITEITATAGQTVFVANGGYTVGYIDVFVNGAQLQTSDFTALDGSSITLAQAAQVGDDVRLVAWGTFSTANAVALVGNSNITGNVNVSGNLGIGTNSPVDKLETVGNNRVSGHFRSVASGIDGIFGANQFASGVVGIGSASNHPITFNTNLTERMRLDTSGNLLFNSGYGSVATAYGCRAWVNFNGQGTVAIRSSGNVSSIGDRGTGQYTVNFVTAMPDTNYSFTFGLSSGITTNPSSAGATAVNASNLQFGTFEGANTVQDYLSVCVAIHR